MQTYLAHEFAKLAGVTVRTLHHYDAVGLLKPSLYSEADYRLYQPGDLVRLQQILTLKYMGFSLKEIRALINSPAYNLRDSLQIQQVALHERIRQLQTAAFAVNAMLAALAPADDETLLGDSLTVIHNLLTDDKLEWLTRYYTPEQQAWLTERAHAIGPEAIAEGQRQWMDLIEKFRAHQHLPAGDAAAQALAAQMHTLITAFTGGNQDVENSLGAMYQDWEEMPEMFRLYEREVGVLMGQAYEIYRTSLP